MNNLIQTCLFKKLLLPVCLFIFTITTALQVNAQEKPPRPITVTVSPSQQLNFGKIIPNGIGGGTVTVDKSGFRTCSGQILLLSDLSTSPALFIVNAVPGTLVTISPIAGSVLVNGSYSMALTLGEPSTGYIFLTTGESTNVFIGGTLIVGPLSSNPAGAYSGTFSVTFIQQ